MFCSVRKSGLSALILTSSRLHHWPVHIQTNKLSLAFIRFVRLLRLNWKQQSSNQNLTHWILNQHHSFPTDHSILLNRLQRLHGIYLWCWTILVFFLSYKQNTVSHRRWPRIASLSTFLWCPTEHSMFSIFSGNLLLWHPDADAGK